MFRAQAIQEKMCHVKSISSSGADVPCLQHWQFRRECAMFKLFSLLGFLKDGTISNLSLQLAQNTRMLVPKIVVVLK
jgi:hypothetical protein